MYKIELHYTYYIKYSGFVVSFNKSEYKRGFSFLTKQREITLALQGCEQSV